MPAPTPDEFWRSLVRSRLIEADAAAAVRADYAALPPATAGDGSAPAIAAWLVSRGTLSRWQAKQLLTGGTTPFFLGDYRLVERHDRAGETLVFTGRHDPTGRTVTLVLLHAKRCRDPRVWSEIVARAAIAARATDPMLVGTRALEQVDAARFVVCEHVAGEGLADEIERQGPLPPDQAALVVWQAAKAVATWHAAGGVHGGLSLDAFLREPAPAGGAARSGRVRLLQFPLASDPHLAPPRVPLEDPAALERLGRRAAFIAPELAEGGICTPRSDVYALGSVLHALLTGQDPCRSGDASRTPAADVSPGPPGPAPLPATVPRGLQAVVARMLDRDPDQRQTDAGAVADDLARCLGIAAPPLPPSSPAVDPAPDASAFDFAAVDASRGTRRHASRRERGRRQATRLAWIGIAATMLLAAGAAVFMVSRAGVPPRREPVAQGPSPAAPPPAAGTADHRAEDATQAPAPSSAAASPRQIVVDDPALPWASPTSGPPPTLAYLLPGAEVVLLARVADVATDEEGGRFLRALGPAVESALARLVTLCGGDESALEVVQAGWRVDDGDDVVGGVAVWFGEGRLAPADDAARQRAWGPTKATTIAGETVFEGETLSFWQPAAERGRVLVIAPARPGAGADESPMARMIGDVAPLAADESLPVKAALPVALETLVGMLDADRHVTLLASPQSLLRTGREILAGPLAVLADPLDAWCGESLQAAALSLQFGDSCYVEVDAVASPDVPPSRLARDLAGRIDGLADRVERSCVSLDPDPYGRTLVLRLPAMLRILTDHVRSGAEGPGAVLNAYLPRHAAHNIALAAELTLAQVAGRPKAAAGRAPPAGDSASVRVRLGKRISLTFASDTLERSLLVLADETGVPIEILGGDLEGESITRNQSFALDERDKPALEILRAILEKASPEGKLVAVVTKEDGVERVLITTRAAAGARGDELPPASAVEAAAP